MDTQSIINKIASLVGLEKQVKLGKNYDNELLFGSTKIVYHCTKCNIENNKSNKRKIVVKVAEV